MNEAKIAQFKRLFEGKRYAQFDITEYINSGKSAAVFKAIQAGKLVALKVFDPELIETHGDGTQQERIKRELLLIGKKHDHLVEILDGGECEHEGQNYFYIAMEYIPWVNLSEEIQKEKRGEAHPIGAMETKQIIKQLATAAKHLEDQGICHRDIKPENIAISADHQTIKLLDLGVIRPVLHPNITDIEIKPFIGTLRYASPEFLFRKESPTPEGYRAITFYQIGGVLHDLITKNQLFQEHSHPYAALVKAVETIAPTLTKPAITDSKLSDLARCCLLKDPHKRTSLIEWEDFNFTERTTPKIEEIRKAILRRKAIHEPISSELPPHDTRLLSKAAASISASLRKICAYGEVFPRYQICEHQFSAPPVSLISLHFEPNNKWSPLHHYQITLLVRQAEEDVFSIAISASYSGKAKIDDTPSIDPRATVFWSGAYSSIPPDPVLQDMIFRCIENFLQATGEEGTIKFED